MSTSNKKLGSLARNIGIGLGIAGIGIAAFIGYKYYRDAINMTEKGNAQAKGYYSFYPASFHQTEAERQYDIQALHAAMKQRTQRDIDFFKLVDIDITKPFKEIVPEVSRSEMLQTIHNPEVYWTILKEKYYYNRARPFQHDNSVLSSAVLQNKTTSNPSYPSGHAVQSYVLAIDLAKRFPDRKDQLYEVAERIALSRVQGGVHYPSDIRYGKELAEKMYLK